MLRVLPGKEGTKLRNKAHHSPQRVNRLEEESIYTTYTVIIRQIKEVCENS